MLIIKDNGVGVRSCDLPYIFEKGFTGYSGEGRKKATGMGLYLAKEIAEGLNIILSVNSEWGKGFEMQIAFPLVAFNELRNVFYINIFSLLQKHGDSSIIVIDR